LAGETLALREMFDHAMKVAVSAEKIDDVVERAAEWLGTLRAQGRPVVAQTRGADLFDYPLAYERRAAHFQIVIRDGQVAGMLLRPGHPTGRWRRSRGLIRELLPGR